MQKFIISIKDKNTGRDFISPFTVDSLDGYNNRIDHNQRQYVYQCTYS
jgi:hypothetical protein